MKRLLVSCSALLLIISGARSAGADGFNEAQQLLESMATAMAELSYQGTFVYVRGEDVETIRITHVNDAKGVRERLHALNGPPREVIRDRDGVRCALGAAGQLSSEAALGRSLFPDIPVQALSAARARYLFEVGGTARIAGFGGRRLTILPRDEFRYGYDLWLEQDSGLLLRWVLYDNDRRTLAKLMFTELRIGDDVDASELDSPTPQDQFVRLAPQTDSNAPVVAAAQRAQEQPEGVPPGFELAARGERPAGTSEPFEHLVFSDGLASVSVYIETTQATGNVAPGLSRMGTTNAYSSTIGGRQVTAIGEVPAATVKAISNAFARSSR